MRKACALTAACLERAAAIAAGAESWETAARLLGAAAAMRDRMVRYVEAI